MARTTAALTLVPRRADDGDAAELPPREIISDAPMCVRLDPLTGEFREEPVLAPEPQTRPMRLMRSPRPPAALARSVPRRRTGTG